jgi:hypothetical protein
MRLNNNTILLAILALLLILLSNSFYASHKLHVMQSKMDVFFAPIEDAPLPSWHDEP